MRKVNIASWSNVLPAKTYIKTYEDGQFNNLISDRKFIPRGLGRSFGDASYISNGITILSTKLNKIIDFDESKGMVVCQSGVLMCDLLKAVNNSGWELPVMGGTGWITVGGAVAADIHSKNHESAGTFGCHVKEVEIVLPNSSVVTCSPEKNDDLFSATIGGMGLTGFIKSVTIQLRRRKGNALLLTTKKFVGIGELFNLFESDRSEYRVGWIDFGPKVPRGIYYSAKNSDKIVELNDKAIKFKPPRLKFINKHTVTFFNMLRYLKSKDGTAVSDPKSFQWKTDSFMHYNYLFGAPGFHEYQFVAPLSKAKLAIFKFMETFRKYGLCPSFVVLKKFGPKTSPGLLSFPLEGYTVNPSFEVDPRNDFFFREFTEYIISIGGRFNLSKDSSLASSQFEMMYKGDIASWRRIVKKYDPKNRVQSDMSERLKMKTW